MCQGSFNGVSGRFKEDSRVFKESLKGKGVSRKIEGCFVGDFSGFQGYLKELQFKRSFRGILRMFKGTSKGVPRKFLGCFKED